MMEQQIVNGVMIGAGYALIALGFTMIFGILNVLHFAHPEVLMLGAFAVMLAMVNWGWPFWLALLLGMLVAAAIGLAIERIVLRPLLFAKQRKVEHLTPLMATIGVGLFLRNVASIVFGPDRQFFPDSSETVFWDVAGVSISNKQLLVFGITLTLVALLTWLVKGTRLGLAIRATAENADVASSLGVSVRQIVTVVMVIASVLGAAGGALLGMLYNGLSPYSGIEFSNKALVAMILGGAGSLPGAVIASLLLGVSESLTVGFFASSWRDAVSFGVLVLLLLVRPSGLLGQHVDTGRRV